MAYDEDVADRIRQLTAGDAEVTETRMFGGLAFLVAGHMAVAAGGQGGIMVRVNPEEAARLVETTSARFMEMRGRPMRGWLRVDSDDLATEPQLAGWVALGTSYARTLPPKR